MPLARRGILTGSAAGVGLVVSGSVPSLAAAGPERHRRPSAGQRPFPPLVDDPNGILALPPGFAYEIVTYAGRTQLNDGKGPTPSNHDGTAVFNARRGSSDRVFPALCLVPPARQRSRTHPRRLSRVHVFADDFRANATELCPGPMSMRSGCFQTEGV